MSTAQAVRPKRAQGAKRRTKGKPQNEPPAVTSGRFIIAFVILALLVFVPFSPLKDLLVPNEEVPATNVAQWQVGKKATVAVTLVTADYDRLACVSSQTYDGKHCEYKEERKSFPRDPSEPPDNNKQNIIQPYRTWPDNKLILIAGLWAEPALATRLHSEPPSGVPVDKLARFTAECEMRFIGKMDQTQLRWQPGQKWVNEGSALVAEPLSCKVLPPDVPGVP